MNNFFWKKKPKKKVNQKPKPKKSVSVPSKPIPVFEPKPFVPPEKATPFVQPAMPKKVSTPVPLKKPDIEKDFLGTFEELTQRHRAWEVWRDFIVMSACSISNSLDKSHYDEREARYMKAIKKYNKQEQQLFPKLFAYMVLALEENPEQDFLGHIFMLLELEDKRRQQFFTPYNICQLMSSIVMEDVAERVREEGYITINDCCCGAGATLIASIHEARRKLEKEKLNFQNHILVAAQDIDETVALMCYIQLSLLGVAAYVKVGNSITEPMTADDNLDNYWFSPMYFSSVWSMRRAIHEMDALFQKGEHHANYSDK